MTYHLAGPSWIDSDGMHMAHSSDGHNWEPLLGSERCKEATRIDRQGSFCRHIMFRPQAGKERIQMSIEKNGNSVLRDPFVIQDPRDGKFHALWTTGWSSNTIGYATSDDLVNWNEQKDLDV